ncbi:MAG: putative signal peptide protein [Polaromonas sp.]|nr:putative signal peptide protein [Polaromonas sp.]
MSHPLVVSRRAFATGTAVAAATLAFPALRAQGKLEKTKLALSVGGKAAFYYLPLTISEQLGYFKDEGLDV